MNGNNLRRGKFRHALLFLVSCALLAACVTREQVTYNSPTQLADKDTSKDTSVDSSNPPVNNAQPTLTITTATQTGTIENPSLNEISGLSASLQSPGVLYALNDSGNPAVIYALNEKGANLGQWNIDARNRDWEDLASWNYNNQPYLVIGDTGNNLQRDRSSTLYIIEEPSLETPRDRVIKPIATINFNFDDGPRNVESLAIADNTLYLISKEPVGADGPQASRLYTLDMVAALSAADNGANQGTDAASTPILAQFVGELPLSRANLEARLAATLAGVDLNHITALDFDIGSNSAYLLTYRHVLRIQRQVGQSWETALLGRSAQIYSHKLRQAESLAIIPGKSVWITSEYEAAPLLALPLSPPT